MDNKIYFLGFTIALLGIAIIFTQSANLTTLLGTLITIGGIFIVHASIVLPLISPREQPTIPKQGNIATKTEER